MDRDARNPVEISRSEVPRNDLIYRKKRLQENFEPGDEQVLRDREQRELDGVPSLFALRDEHDQAP